jgi:hypothetical protein
MVLPLHGYDVFIKWFDRDGTTMMVLVERGDRLGWVTLLTPLPGMITLSGKLRECTGLQMGRLPAYPIAYIVG